MVQRQLVEQNSQLKKEAAIAERKLATRTERIRNLEGLLHDSQEKLTAASHRFVHPFSTTHIISSPLSSEAAETSPCSDSSADSRNPSADKMLRQRRQRQNLRQMYERQIRDDTGRMRMPHLMLVTQQQGEEKWGYVPDAEAESVGEGESLWTAIPSPPKRNFPRPFPKQDTLGLRIENSTSSSGGTTAETATIFLTVNNTTMSPDLTSPSQSPPRTPPANTRPLRSRFEVQLQSVKERLEAAKAGSTRGLGGPGGAGGGFNFGVGPRIAKPLRGGGGGGGSAVSGEMQQQQLPVLSAAGQEGGKRGSWFFNQRN